MITFDCFGARCSVDARGEEEAARTALLDWHRRFTRFSSDSELSRMNAAKGPVVVSKIMARFVRAALAMAELTDGLVDATLLRPLEAAGYVGDLGRPLPLAEALTLAPRRRPAAPAPDAGWRRVGVHGPVVELPAGVGLDSGGIAKGLLADVLAQRLKGTFAINCAGDLRLGGASRDIHVASPFDTSTLHTYTLAGGGVATSGIGRRAWLDSHGRPAHHLLDPSTGRPAYTGVVQATALAPTALEAEARAKAAVLSGPDAASAWLPHGGVVVYDDGTHDVLH